MLLSNSVDSAELIRGKNKYILYCSIREKNIVTAKVLDTVDMLLDSEKIRFNVSQGSVRRTILLKNGAWSSLDIERFRHQTSVFHLTLFTHNFKIFPMSAWKQAALICKCLMTIFGYSENLLVPASCYRAYRTFQMYCKDLTVCHVEYDVYICNCKM